MITVFGSINMDLVARVPIIARPGETVLSRRADSFSAARELIRPLLLHG